MSRKYKEIICELSEQIKTEKGILNKIGWRFLIGFLSIRANRIVRILGEVMVDAGNFLLTSMLIIKYGAAIGLAVNVLINTLWSVMTIELEELAQINGVVMMMIYVVNVFNSESMEHFAIRYGMACLIYLLIKELISYADEKASEGDDRLLTNDTTLQNPTEAEEQL